MGPLFRQESFGSSPRARSRHLAVWLLEGLGRLIPACAEQTD